MKIYKTIIAPVLTEKSSKEQLTGAYTFLVNRDATKIDIKNAVEKIYGKKVQSVRTSIQPKKTRIVGRGRVMTKRRLQKLAKVRLVGKETMDPNNIKDSKDKKVKKTTKSEKPTKTTKTKQ